MSKQLEKYATLSILCLLELKNKKLISFYKCVMLVWVATSSLPKQTKRKLS